MTLTKTQIVKRIRKQLAIPEGKSFELVETLLELIKKSLENGEDVLISGFGKFSVRKKKERRGRNPATGGEMMIESRKVVTFKSSGKLRDKINGCKETR